MVLKRPHSNVGFFDVLTFLKAIATIEYEMFRLNNSGLKALSTLCTNFSAVFLGSLIIPSFFVDKIQWALVLFGVGGGIILAYFAILFAQKGKL